MSSEASLLYAYHAGSPEAPHVPLHGGVAVYTQIPDYPSRFVGTLAGIVIHRSTKEKLLLSNQHVFFPYQSGSKKIKPGLSVYHSIASAADKPIAKTLITKAEKNPWPKEIWAKDRGKEALSSVGTYHDSALAVPLVPVSMEVNNIGRQKSMVEPKRGMRIKYFGRTSRLKRGVITNPAADSVTDAGNGKVSVKNNVITADIASAPGDSGSMVFTDDNHVVGVLYGARTELKEGAPGKTLICKASAIAKAYNVAFSEDEVKGPYVEPGKETEKEKEKEKKPVPFPIEFPKLELPKLSLDFTDKSTLGLLALGGIATAVIIGGYLVTRK
jgi:hypothetical protein